MVALGLIEIDWASVVGRRRKLVGEVSSWREKHVAAADRQTDVRGIQKYKRLTCSFTRVAWLVLSKNAKMSMHFKCCEIKFSASNANVNSNNAHLHTGTSLIVLC
jgi:hypothetical protein